MPNLNLIFFYLTPKYLKRYERPGPVVTSYNRTKPANVGPRAGARRSGTAVYASYVKFDQTNIGQSPVSLVNYGGHPHPRLLWPFRPPRYNIGQSSVSCVKFW